MSFFTRAATTALTGFAILGFASAAFADHVTPQPWNDEEMAVLSEAAIDVGIDTYADIGPCVTREGLMGAFYQRGSLLVCTKAHGEDMAELADTVRHELLHAVQFCLNRDMIHPSYEDQYVEDAQDYLHMPMMAYDPEDWGGEAEARVLASILSEEEIAVMLREACANHTWPKNIPGNN